VVIPPFDLQGGITLALARNASVAALLSAFGTITFRVLVAPRAFARMTPEMIAATKRTLLLLAQLSIAAAIGGTGVWLVVQSAALADADSAAAGFAAVPKVVAKTSFGHVVLLQLAVLLGLAAVLGWREPPRERTGRLHAALAVGIIAVALQSGHSHAFSMVQGPSLLLACDILHLCGAGAWLGGLVPLLLVVRRAPPKAAAEAARWFSPLGKACIAALVVSAALQGWVLVPSIPGLIGTAYGWMVLVKLALFGVLFGFAWFNRYRFAPALLRGDPERARAILARSLMLQTGFAIAIVAAAAVLSELPPAMHLQPLWPFAERFSPAAVQEDPDIRREVLRAGLVPAAALAVLVVTLLVRRFRVAALVATVAAAWFAAPHLDVLFVTGYPTSFYRSPTGFTSASIVDGSATFAQACVSCHGNSGAGDGPLAKRLPIPPADLTAAHLWAHSDGELFWWISHGMFTPEGEPVMPGFAGTLDDDSVWDVIDYIRAHNAGTANQGAGGWPRAVKAPDFGARCDGRPLQLSDLRGRFVRLVFGAVPRAAGNDNDAATILVAPSGGRVPAVTCITSDETVGSAYAIISGVAPAAMAGTQILIDDAGWLRALQKPALQAGWDDPKALRAEIADLRAHKVTGAAAVTEPMKMPM
jgi:putative copper export protein/mono/diheme cytochrome c family protein